MISLSEINQIPPGVLVHLSYSDALPLLGPNSSLHTHDHVPIYHVHAPFHDQLLVQLGLIL